MKTIINDPEQNDKPDYGPYRDLDKKVIDDCAKDGQEIVDRVKNGEDIPLPELMEYFTKHKTVIVSVVDTLCKEESECPNG